MDAFGECGWPAFVVIGASGTGLVFSLAALAVAFFKPNIGLAMAALALAYGCTPGAVGVYGTHSGKSLVDAAVSGASLRPEQRERIRAIGYQEAETCTGVALFYLALVGFRSNTN